MAAPRTHLTTGSDVRLLETVNVASSVTATPRPANADRFPAYADAREIAPGAYVARQRDGAGFVAIRMVADEVTRNPATAANLDRAAQMRLPDIVPVLDRQATTDGQPFVVREHVNGVPIVVYARGDALGQSAEPPTDWLVRLFVRIGGALAAAHALDVLHGDLGVESVLIDPSGRPYLVDFGVRLSAQANAQADVSALGKMLFDALRQRAAPTDSRLADIASRAMSRDSRIGYATAAEFVEALESYLTSEPPRATLTEARSMATRWLADHIEVPRSMLLVGGVTGFMAGTFASVPATNAIARTGELHFLWLLTVVVAALLMGVVATVCARPKSKVGHALVGATTGTLAGIVAWILGAGGFVNTAIQLTSAREANVLAAAVADRPAFTAQSSFDVPADHAQDQLAVARPDVARLRDAQKVRAIHRRLESDLRSGAYLAAWLSPTLPVLVGMGLGLIGTAAWGRATHNGRGWLLALNYAELALPGQIAVLVAAATVMFWAGGELAWSSLVIAPSIASLALAIVIAVRCDVPLIARIACYLGGAAFFCRMAAIPLAMSIEIPAYLFALAMLTRQVAAIPRPALD